MILSSACESLTATHYHPIETAQAGQTVTTRNPSTGQTEARRIVSVSHSHTDRLLALTLCDAVTGQAVETIEATRQHPFYVEGKGFVAAAALGIGNAIVTRAGPSLVVGKMAWERRTAGYEVYNLIVEGDHTYFVGDSSGGVWVHNGPGDNCVKIAKAFQKKYGGDVHGLTPDEGSYVYRAHDPVSGPKDADGYFHPWDSHYVHVQDGAVRDPMMLGHNNPVPLKEWQTHFNSLEKHTFKQISPERLKTLR